MKKQYELNLKKIKVGDIVCFRTRWSPFSFVIRALTKGKINHVGQVVFINDYMPFFIHAHASFNLKYSKVVEEPLAYYLRKNIDITVVRVKEELFENKAQYEEATKEVVKRAHQYLGKPYDFLGIIGFIPVIVGRWLWLDKIHKFKNYLQQRYELFCSELIVLCWWKLAPKSLFDNHFAGKKYSDAATTSPQDIIKTPNIEYITGRLYPELLEDPQEQINKLREEWEDSFQPDEISAEINPKTKGFKVKVTKKF